MTFSEALAALISGKKIYRTDWGYPTTAYLIVEKHMGHDQIWIANQYPLSMRNDLDGYGFSLFDTQTDTWDIYPI